MLRLSPRLSDAQPKASVLCLPELNFKSKMATRMQTRNAWQYSRMLPLCMLKCVFRLRLHSCKFRAKHSYTGILSQPLMANFHWQYSNELIYEIFRCGSVWKCFTTFVQLCRSYLKRRAFNFVSTIFSRRFPLQVLAKSPAFLCRILQYIFC